MTLALQWSLKIDWNAVTAIATLLAILVALFQESVRRWFNSPNLKVTWRSRDIASMDTDPVFDRENVKRIYRILVRNTGRDAARNVEAVLTDLYNISEVDNYFFKLVPNFLPTALRWTHSDLPRCEYLPGKTDRLCDLGLYLNVAEQKGTRDVFEFATAIAPTSEYNKIERGEYLARIVVSAINCKSAEIVLSIRIGIASLGSKGEESDSFNLSGPQKGLLRVLRKMKW